MDITQLKYFKVVADLQNMTKASKVLHVSQPFLSQTVKALEGELRTTLFDRQGKYIYLNEDGKLFLAYTNRMLELTDAVQNELADRHDQAKRLINLAYQVPLGCGPDLIRRFQTLCPDIRLMFRYCHQSRMKDAVYDLLLFVDENWIENCHTICLGSEEFVIALPPSHPLAACEEVDLADLKDDPFISVPVSSQVREITDEICTLAGIRPNIILEDDFNLYILNCVEEGIGVALVPNVTWIHQLDRNIAYRRLKNITRTRYIYLGWRENSYLSRSHHRFITFLKAYFSPFQKQNPVR